MLDYLVLYTSHTGNTRQLAMELFAKLPGSSKDVIHLETVDSIPRLLSQKEAKVYFIGFFINCGSCSVEIIDTLAALHNKKIVLFGTCGMSNSPEYFQAVSRQISAFISEDCEYLGCYLCQGKMPISVRNHCEAMLEKAPDNTQLKLLIQNFDEALLHPDAKDLAGITDFLEKLPL